MIMKPDFDLFEFINNLKATKPPYECPFEQCRKVYRSCHGMEQHIHKCTHNALNRNEYLSSNSTRSETAGSSGTRWHHKGGHGNDSGQTSPADFARASACNREALTYAEAQKMVEFEVDGKIFRIDINEPLNIVNVDGKNGDMPDLSSVSGGNAVNGHDVHNRSESPTRSPSRDTTHDTPKSGKGKPTKGKGKKTKPGKYGSKNRKETNTSSSVNTPLTVNTTNTVALKLPEPSFRIIEDYQCPDAPPRSSSYYRFIEKTTEENEEELVEYDMDEEDTAWLELVNKKRKADKLELVDPDTFEKLMDRLEKESYFQSQSSGKEVGPAIDEDAVCCICNDGECQNSNAILFCDMCNLAVHQECYGVPYIPEGQWLCRRCLQSPSRAVDCVLCPNKGGAFKQTDDNRWAHVVCALWIPEVCFANTVFLEPIDSIKNIPSARWKLSCYVCKQRSVGACIQCHKANCYVAFHVTCAQQAGLYMKMEAVKEMTASGVVTNVRKAAFCDAHTPADDSGTTGLSGVYSSVDGDEDDECESKKAKQTKAHFKERMKKARKILAEKRCAIPVVSVPTMPLDKLTKIATIITIPKRNQFLQLLLGYWSLKRQSRNGVPLLRRLQISHSGSRNRDVNNRVEDNEHTLQLKEQHKTLQRLRQDLEKARLLVEMIKKRERQKKILVEAQQAELEATLNPYKIFLRLILNKLQEKDEHHENIFAYPVDISEVPDYLDFIEHPMDFSTMRKKLDQNQYSTLSELESDFNLMIKNCMIYNSKDTLWHKAALKLSDQASVIFKEARRRVAMDFNEKTGFFLETNPIVPLLTPTKLIVNHFNDDNRVKSDIELKLEKLKEELTKEKENAGDERTTKVRSLTAAIAHAERQIKLGKQKSTDTNSTEPVSSASPDKQQVIEICENVKDERKANRNRNRNRTTGEKKKKRRQNTSESEATTTASNELTIASAVAASVSPAILAAVGRKTQNSIVATLNSQDHQTSTINATASFNDITESESQQKKNNKRKRNNAEPSRARKSLKVNNKKSKAISNGTTNKITNYLIPLGRRKVNGSALNDQLSPVSNSSVSSISNHNLDNNSSLILKTRNATRSSLNRKTIDASTCTPPNMFTLTAESFAKEQAIKGQASPMKNVKRRSNRPSGRSAKRQQTNASSLQLSDQSNPFSPSSIPHQSDSFRVYRNLNSPADSDINSNHSSQSCGSSSLSSGSSGSSSGSSGSGSSSGESRSTSRASSRVSNRVNNTRRLPNSQRRTRSQSSHSDMSDTQIPLQPNDLVWAKSPGFPWYPALVVNPDKSKAIKNGVSIPIPPDDVLTSKDRDNQKGVYLVSFFDVKRTWQWLARDKLEPLGMDIIDKVKLNEARKQSDKRNVKAAYEKAVLFCLSLKQSKNLLDE